MSVSGKAQELYDKMVEKPAGTFFSQDDLERLTLVLKKLIVELVQ